MSFIPEEELKERSGLTLAPMIDFLFLMLAVFASLAFSRIVMRDTSIDLVKSKTQSPAVSPQVRESKLIQITVSENGEYKWVTDIRDYPIETSKEIAEELVRQYESGLLPEDKKKTHILLKIDRNARWEPILQVLLAIKEVGFDVHPVYEPI